MRKIFLLLIFVSTLLNAQYSKMKVDTIYKYRNTSRVFIKDTANIIFNGNRTVTRSGLPAVNTGKTNLIDFMNDYFFPSTSPTATLSNSLGASKEFSTAGSQAVTLSWGITRPIACQPISSVIVNGTTITPTPVVSEGGSYNNTQSATITNNSNTTYSMSVTASDGKSGSASSTVTWYWKRYFGCFTSGVAPTTNAGIGWISNAQILSLSGSELSSSYAKNFGSVNCSATYYVYAFPHSFGTPTFLVNTFPTGFVQVWTDLTFSNASGGTVNYDVWVSPFPYAGAFTLVAQ